MNLKSFYGILALLSTVAATQSMIFPRWPDASKISTEKIDQFMANISSNGHTVKPSTTLGNHSNYNVSHTSIISSKINSNSDLLFTNVQVRDRKDLSVSHITESIKSLQLTKSAIMSKQPPYFLSDTKPSGTTYQTCFVQGNPWPFGLAVNQDTLTLAVDQAKSLETNLAIKRFLGLSPSRNYQCILITLKTTLPIKEGNQMWLDVLHQFQNTFNNKK
jgi:hypothetical protein